MPLSKVWAGSLVLLAAVSLPLHAASPVKVGSKIDTEGALLGNIILQVLKATEYQRSIKCNLERLLWCAGRLLPVNWISIRNIPAMARFSLKMKTMQRGKTRSKVTRKSKTRCRAKQVNLADARTCK